ncbi:unnamed protein product (macronuclear) [Paramecium tetraurelia]|uniref:Protein kinase domain-containing protein n=1 Tax=Paramecium tetraurelia TaxID=5888 RepID=A0EBP2_PARTE|nr:uncharacterized protein GSPATT00025443001 [Paramecium tetraurelia]CAK92709.1 unnamed protein product [Paramecium tetraurelia]|eukprot:XP_001460106.1 hypothetical protein (macronuclear) [Paramecium tetraurelia strain d4-2]
MPKLYTFKDPNFNPLQNYVVDKTLGQGTFGKVKMGIHKCTNEKVAIKILEKEKIENEADYVRIQREIHILRKIRHPNIIQLYEIIESEIKLYLITEYAPGGELFEHIVSKSRLEEREAGRIFFQLLNAIEYIHQLGIVHRDLKPENILLDSNKQVKVVDFGLSNLYQPNQKLHTPCGSPCYAAPEMVSGLPYEGLKTDIWSCGIILYAMICGCVPFEDQNTKQLYEKIKHSDYKLPKSVSPQAADLLRKILQKDPSKRITIPEIRQHDFILFAGKMTIPEGVNTKLDNFKIDVDYTILQQLLQYNISEEEAVQMIKNNKHNCITTCYYLLKLKQQREKQIKPEIKPEVPSKPISIEKQNIFNKTPIIEQQKSSPLVKQKLYSQQQPIQPYNQDVQQQILLHLLQNQQQQHQLLLQQQAQPKEVKQPQVSKVAETGGSSSMEMFLNKAFSDRNQNKSQTKGKTKSQDPVPHRDTSAPKKPSLPSKNQKSISQKPSSQSKGQLAQLLAVKQSKYLGNTDSTTYVRHKSNLKFKQGSTERSDRHSSNSQRSEITYLKRSVENRSSQHIKNDRKTRMISTYAYNDTQKPIQTQPNERIYTDLSKEQSNVLQSQQQRLTHMDNLALGIQIYKHNVQNRFLIKQQQKRKSKQQQ